MRKAPLSSADMDGRRRAVYIACMSSKISTTVRLDPEDVAALEKARADGHSGSELIRRGLRLVAAPYYERRRAPTTGLFVSTDAKLGDESELLRLMGCEDLD